MYKKVTALFFSTILIVTLNVACNLFCASDSCGCGSPSASKDFLIKGFQTSDIIITSNSIDTTSFFDYRERFKVIKISEFDYEASNTSKMYFPFANFAISTAYACSPIPPKAIHSIKSIKVITTNEISFEGVTFDSETDISSLFMLSNYPTSEGASIPDFLNQLNDIYLEENIYLRLKNAPESETTFQFDINIKLENEQDFVLSNQLFKVK